jgi:hypothetical protein
MNGAGQPPNEPNAVTAMVLGILGLAICSLVAPFAWAIGKKSVDNIAANPGQYAGEGMAKAGHIMGIIGTILLIVSAVLLIFWFALAGAMVGKLAE